MAAKNTTKVSSQDQSSAMSSSTTPSTKAIKMTPFEHGAAGHQGISTDDSGSLLIKPCTQAEVDFYTSATSYPDLAAHMPTFLGSLTLNSDQQDTDKADATASSKEKEWTPSGGAKLSTGLAIVLSNATSGFTRPNVLDVKLGARLWDDDAPQAKRQKLDAVANETTSGSLGFRVAGMKVWLGSSAEQSVPEAEQQQEKVELHTTISKDGYKVYDKFYGRSLNDENVKSAFVKFFGGGSERAVPESRKVIMQRILQKIKDVQKVLENQESRMYSASILMVCEGDEKAAEVARQIEESLRETKSKSNGDMNGDEEGRTEGIEDEEEEDEDEDEEEQPKLLDVKLIDFAHAHWTPGQGPDENALKGVRNVVRTIEEILS